mgnify:CR=1 FL=1
MAFPKISEVRALKDEEIADEIVAVKRQLFELRLQKATRRLEKTHEFIHTKHRLAQLLTVESERQRSNETTTPSAGKKTAAVTKTEESKPAAVDVTEAKPDPATESEQPPVES